MLDANLKQQLESYLRNITQPVELVMSIGDGGKSYELRELLEEIVVLSDKLTLLRDDSAARKPSFMIRRAGTDIGVRFAGIPMGHEFTSLVLALLQVGGHPSKAAQYWASHPGEVCPAKWEEGEQTLAPSLDLVGKI